MLETAMSHSTRSELFRVLEELSDHYPHWRIGQLVSNMAGIADVNVWDVEDEQLLAAAKDYLVQRSPTNGGADDTEHSGITQAIRQAPG